MVWSGAWVLYLLLTYARLRRLISLRAEARANGSVTYPSPPDKEVAIPWWLVQC